MSATAPSSVGERSAIVLAAGKGRRMSSAAPKVLHEVGGRPLLEWVLEAARAVGCCPIWVVVGHGADRIRESVEGSDLVWVQQGEQLGTGHAVAQVEPHWRAGGSTTLVLYGDAPLVRPETLERLLVAAEAGWGALGVAELDEPGSLGRVIEGPDGQLQAIVEVADATPRELAVRTVNSGHYALRAPDIFTWLAQLEPRNAQGELYLTDAVVSAAGAGRPVACVRLGDEAEAWGVNDRRDLARVHQELNRRLVERHQLAGVTILSPDRVTLGPAVQIAADCVIHPDTTLLGETVIESGAELHCGVWVRDCHLGEAVVVMPYSVLEGAHIESGCSIGPFARLRPGSVIGRGARVGNFVEVKQTRLGEGARASHLAYLGDATVGAGSNIGAGVITCNYDGEKKHRTEIGDHAFIGSDTMLVAPVKVGDRAITGAGSVITDEVPDDSLALGRSRQRNLRGWRDRRRR